LYKFNNQGETRLLNNEYLFYLSNNQLFAHYGHLEDGEYDLYVQQKSKFHLEIDVRQHISKFLLPKSLIYSKIQSKQINLMLFSIKLNLSIQLDDLLDSN
jgi:hypothetical protein